MFDRAVPLTGPAFGDLLDRVVGGRRIVVLGESHHFVHETYELRRAVLTHLGSRGRRTLGTEIAFGDGGLLEQYLADGDPAHLDRVGTFGYRMPASRAPAGVLADTLAGFPAAAFRAETVRVLDALRDGGPPWRHVGLDVDYDPAVAASQRHHLRDRDRGRRLARTLATSRRYADAVRSAGGYADLHEPMAWREEVMAGHARYAVDVVAAGGPVVLCGHNLHVGPGVETIEIPGGVGPGGGLVPPLGRVLAEHYPGEVACLWMLHHRGVDGGPPPGGGPFRSSRRSLNAALASQGPAFAVATADVPAFRKAWAIGSMYGAEVHGVPADLCDAILFTAEVTPLRV